MMHSQTQHTGDPYLVLVVARPSRRPSSLALLSAIALGLALVFGTTAGTAGASGLAATHARSAQHHSSRAAAHRVVLPTGSRGADRHAAAAPFLARVRYLPATAARHAQASIVTLVTAWQRGLFRHSATHPVAGWRNVQGQVQQITTPAVVHGDAVHDAIYQASVRWGVSYWYLVRLATCESTLNPGAYNPSGASGLFQFMPSTYYAYGARIGEGRSLWNAYGSANVAAYMISIGQAHQWTCSYYI